MASSVIPLSAAAAKALARLDPGRDPAHSAEGRNIVAAALSALIAIYKRDSRTGKLQRMTEDELSSGRFSKGASAFVFDDGRPDIQALAVREADLEAAIETIATSYIALRFTENPTDRKPGSPGREH